MIRDDSSDTESVSELIEEMMPVLDQVYVNGPYSGKSRIVPVGFLVPAEYIDNESDSDNSEQECLPSLIPPEVFIWNTDSKLHTDDMN